MVLYSVDSTSRVKTEIPLDCVHVAVRVVNFVAEVQVVQFYVNPHPHPIHCVYEFPLDERSAVCGFEVEFQDKLLIGEVKSKSTAREEFQRAKSQGQTAALLEENKPDMFVQHLANCSPHSRLNIRIVYVTELSIEAETGAAIFVLPTSIAPRYSPSCSSLAYNRPWQESCFGRRIYPVPSTWNGLSENLPFVRWPHSIPTAVVSQTHPGRFSIAMEMDMASKVIDVKSQSGHQIDTGYQENNAFATLWNGTEAMGKDFIVAIYTEKPFEPIVQLEFAEDGQSGCAMMTLVPEFDLEPEPREIIFLVDCSGSMESRIEGVKRALRIFLPSLPMSCQFNIVKFGSRYTSLFTSAQAYTQSTLNAAHDFVNQLKANMEGTELLRPLKDILTPKSKGNGLRQVFILTDGEVSNTEELLSLVQKHAETNRVFSVGVGDEVSRHLVQGLARQGRGTCEFISSAQLNPSNTLLASKLINQLKMATLPAITQVDVDWYGGKAPTPPPLASNFFPTPNQNPGAMRWEGRPQVAAVNSQHAINSGVLVDVVAQAPFLTPPLFSKGKFTLFAMFSSRQMLPTRDTKVRLEAQGPQGGKLILDIPLVQVTSLGRSLHVLAARNLIRDLEEETSYLHWEKLAASQQQQQQGNWPFMDSWLGREPVQTSTPWKVVKKSPPLDRVKQRIVELGTRFQLVSKETSFVAVERWRDGRSGQSYSSEPLPMNTQERGLRGSMQLQSLSYSQGFGSASASAKKGFGSASANQGFAPSPTFRYMDTRQDEMMSPPPRSSAVLASTHFNLSASYAPPAYEQDDEDDMGTNLFGAMEEEEEERPRLKKKLAAKRTSSPQTETVAALAPSSSLSTLLGLQQFDGSFKNSPELLTELECSKEQINSGAARVAKEFSCHATVAVMIWLSVLVLSKLEKQFGSQQSIWELSAEKTRNFIVLQFRQTAKKNFAQEKANIARMMTWTPF